MTHRITHTVGRSGRKGCRRSHNAYISSRSRFLHETLHESLSVSMCIPFPPKHLRNHSCGVSDALWHTSCILETAWNVPGNSQEKSKFYEKSQVLKCCPGSWQTSIITPGHAPILYDTVYTLQNCAPPFGTLMVHRNRQSAKSREIIERAQLSREWSTFSKP